jgi:hypothetical protein
MTITFRRIITTTAIVYLAMSQCACAVYTVASVATYAVTDKSLTDHAVSQTSGHDCNITQPFQGKYYCEVRDISVTYNRNRY